MKFSGFRDPFSWLVEGYATQVGQLHSLRASWTPTIACAEDITTTTTEDEERIQATKNDKVSDDEEQTHGQSAKRRDNNSSDNPMFLSCCQRHPQKVDGDPPAQPRTPRTVVGLNPLTESAEQLAEQH